MSREQMIAKAEEAIWSALEGQAERFGYVDRAGVVDMTSIELDMSGVAAAAVDAVLEVLAPDEVWEWKTPESEEL